MKIQEYIDQMIDLSGNEWLGRKVDRITDRDRVLWGDPGQECTGIVSTIYASVEVIEKAHELGCNLIVAHEALFWNHGDHTDWLKDNTAFQKKTKLLDEYKICVWRNHDHIHAGVRLGDVYRDGIMYGMSKMMGWNEYTLNKEDVMPNKYLIPEISARDLSKQIIEKFRLDGVRFIGNPDATIQRVWATSHILGRGGDNEIISVVNDENINCLLVPEMVDFTVNQYIHDAGQLGEDKCIFALGHFNFEEIGMEWYADYIRKYVKPNVSVHFVQAGDYFAYISK